MDKIKEKILHGTLKSLGTVGIYNLKKVILKSEEEKREHALLFCGIDTSPFEKISHSGLCVGTECNVKLKDCKDKQQIGSFHTHIYSKKDSPLTLGNLSGEDIYSSISNRHRFSCIGLIEENKPVIKCFVPSFDIDAITVSRAFMTKDNYYKKLSEYKLSEQKPDGTNKTLEQLLEELPQDKKAILSRTYDKLVEADDKLLQESTSLAKRLQADLIVK